MTDSQTHIENAQRVELVCDRQQISSLIDAILAQAETHEFGSSSLFAIRLAIEEGITNAFEHGHRDLDPSTPIIVDYAISASQIQIAIEDRGPGFSPESLPDPTLQENLSKPSGRGVMLMRAYMTDVVFNEAGNRVKLTYTRAD
ncbi:MAG: ATP-binding protein [Phycisphaerales bacterium]